MQGSAADRDRVIDIYGDNQLELIITAENIRTLYDGDVGAFLADDVATGGDTYGLLERQVDRLDPLARDVVLGENVVPAGQVAWWYSLRMPPSRCLRRMSSRVTAA
ncbi:hypothetical protein [Saccharothrix variisporea]|uniref:hypothetical protein n=1 Tax=Saccharothrix variisporea TaxID=543527 RepID=UPI000EAF7F38|nr:hypothetical protein [Saccharothrix variisporea]